MSKKFINKLMKAAKESGNVLFTKKTKAKEQDNSMKEEGQMKDQGVSLKDRMMNAARSINETTMKGFQRAKKSDNEDKIKEKLDESNDQLKEMGKISWNSLKNNQFDKLKLNFGGSYINKAINEAKDKVEQSIKKLKDKDEQSKQKTQESSTSIQAWKDSLKNVLKNKDSKQQQKKSQSWLGNKMHILYAHLKSMKEMIEKQSNNATGFRLSFISNILQKMYWRVAFFLMLIVFAYGLGTSLPRQIRKIYENANKKEEERLKKKEAESQGKLEQIINIFKSK